ncbi:hypothetical protein SADUNF_Sadunf18G0062400 [Salix dunnii]|uniref:Uncharacterized protein n=1 Tax=Salix dunnii TaxID=1413687 RepID=A0A835MIW7_9ROSI|nr:hypothetical protein SADUNF_Sadunf18G0062400 [Salix dunnii]
MGVKEKKNANVKAKTCNTAKNPVRTCKCQQFKILKEKNVTFGARRRRRHHIKNRLTISSIATPPIAIPTTSPVEIPDDPALVPDGVAVVVLVGGEGLDFDVGGDGVVDEGGEGDDGVADEDGEGDEGGDGEDDGGEVDGGEGGEVDAGGGGEEDGGEGGGVDAGGWADGVDGEAGGGAEGVAGGVGAGVDGGEVVVEGGGAVVLDGGDVGAGADIVTEQETK